jgi:hypothetical protein
VILFARGSNYLGIHPTLHTVIEYQYGSRYSYPAPSEALTREQAISYGINAITDHYSRLGTWAEARIYPFGGLIGDMRVIAVRPRKEYTVDASIGQDTMINDSALVRFGTSTWTYEGWQGQVYLKRMMCTARCREVAPSFIELALK